MRRRQCTRARRTSVDASCVSTTRKCVNSGARLRCVMGVMGSPREQILEGALAACEIAASLYEKVRACGAVPRPPQSLR